MDTKGGVAPACLPYCGTNKIISEPGKPWPACFAAPDMDHGEEIHIESPKAPGTIEHAEGQSFVLYYKDADGNLSIRSVSVWGIRHTDSGVPVLVAKCHLRKATRYFRVDRIEGVA